VLRFWPLNRAGEIDSEPVEYPANLEKQN
jgi:hypothetical protein